ncbi:ABC transporter permease [Nonomuraea sp. LPB2021202275-12-8]|uniref:ABC transporter permease n=1 Tax=Nonomuraea sp. LPB2021202275-12-8 TaxID=3120159 RepID=UPI00300D0D0B
MRAFGIILAKDLRQRLRDGSLLLLGIVLPLTLAFVLGLASGQAEPSAFAVAGQGPFVEQALRPLERSGQISLRAAASPEEGARLVRDGEVAALFAVNGDSIEVIGHAGQPLAVQLARGVAETYNAQRQPATLPVTVTRDGTLDGEELDPRTRQAAGPAVFFLFTLVSGTAGVLAERREGTLVRMLAAPVGRWSVLAAKLGGGVLVGLAAMAVLVWVTGLLFGAVWGAPFVVSVLVVAVVLAASGVAALAGSFARTPEQAVNQQNAVAVVLGLAGGSIFPVPPVGGLDVLGLLSPHLWFLRGLGSGEVAVPALVLLGFAAAGWGLALARTGRTFLT